MEPFVLDYYVMRETPSTKWPMVQCNCGDNCVPKCSLGTSLRPADAGLRLGRQGNRKVTKTKARCVE